MNLSDRAEMMTQEAEQRVSPKNSNHLIIVCEYLGSEACERCQSRLCEAAEQNYTMKRG
jgi:hypothetical protein